MEYVYTFDLDDGLQKITREEGRSFNDEIGIHVYETSFVMAFGLVRILSIPQDDGYILPYTHEVWISDDMDNPEIQSSIYVCGHLALARFVNEYLRLTRTDQIPDKDT